MITGARKPGQSPRTHQVSPTTAQTASSTPVKASDPCSGLVFLGGSSQTSAWTSSTAFAPENPAQRSRGTPTASSHHELECAERDASPTALLIAPGRPPFETAFSVLPAFRKPSAPPTIKPNGSSQRNSRYASPPARTLAATRRFFSAARRGTASATCCSLALFAPAFAAASLARARCVVAGQRPGRDLLADPRPCPSFSSSPSLNSSDPAVLDGIAPSVFASAGAAPFACLIFFFSTK